MRATPIWTALAVATGLVVAPAALAQDDPALDHLRARHAEALRLLGRPASESRDARVAAIIEGLLDVETMTRESCGATWDAMTVDQRAEMLASITTITRLRYRRVLDQMSDWTLEWVGATADGADRIVTIRARSRNEPRAEPQELGFRMRESAGTWRVVDTITGTASTTENHRLSFATVVRRSGIDGLLARARSLAEREAAAVPEAD